MANFQVKLGGEWKDCTRELDSVLKRAWEAKYPNYRSSVNGQQYNYDFKKMIQVNEATGKSREMRAPFKWKWGTRPHETTGHARRMMKPHETTARSGGYSADAPDIAPSALEEVVPAAEAAGGAAAKRTAGAAAKHTAAVTGVIIGDVGWEEGEADAAERSDGSVVDAVEDYVEDWAGDTFVEECPDGPTHEASDDALIDFL